MLKILPIMNFDSKETLHQLLLELDQESCSIIMCMWLSPLKFELTSSNADQAIHFQLDCFHVVKTAYYSYCGFQVACHNLLQNQCFAIYCTCVKFFFVTSDLKTAVLGFASFLHKPKRERNAHASNLHGNYLKYGLRISSLLLPIALVWNTI